MIWNFIHAKLEQSPIKNIKNTKKEDGIISNYLMVPGKQRIQKKQEMWPFCKRPAKESNEKLTINVKGSNF